MSDITLDTLLEAVRFLADHIRDKTECPCRNDQWGYGHRDNCEWEKLDKLTDKLDALIAQRRGRSDDVPAK